MQATWKPSLTRIDSTAGAEFLIQFGFRRLAGAPQTRASLKGSAPIRMGEKGTETGERGLRDEQTDYVEFDDAGWLF